MTYCRNITSVYTLCFFMHTTFIYQKGYILGFNPTNYLIATPTVSSFDLPTTNLFESSQYFDLIE